MKFGSSTLLISKYLYLKYLLPDLLGLDTPPPLPKYSRLPKYYIIGLHNLPKTRHKLYDHSPLHLWPWMMMMMESISIVTGLNMH